MNYGSAEAEHPNFRNGTLLDSNSHMQEELLVVCFLHALGEGLKKSAVNVVSMSHS